MKQKKQRQQEALVRRERNVDDYKSGNTGNLVVPEGVDKGEFLAAKLKNAEDEVIILKKGIGSVTGK